MKASPLQNNFIGGEFSPLAQARVDSDLYPTGLSKCLGFIPLIQGPLTRRPGSYYVTNGKNIAFNTIRLQAFEYSNVQAYVLEFGDEYIRFFRNNGPVETSPGVPYEIVSPYPYSIVNDLHIIQSADVLYIFHKSFPPKKLSRVSHTNWVLSGFEDSDGPYMAQNVGATTMTPSAVNGVVTITASAATFDTAIGGANEIGRMIRLKHSATWGYAKIASVISSTQVTATVLSDFGGTTAVTIWRLGLWCGVNGYPGTATFHEDRLCIGGNTKFPQRVDGSCTADYENFKPTAADGVVTAANAISFTLNSKDVNVIQWITSDEKGLLVGTTSGEWTVRAASSLEAMNATNITAKRGSSYGSVGVQPLQVGRSALFVQKSGRKLRDMRYYFDVDGFRAADLTLLSEHITEGGIKQIALQKDPQQIIWAVRGDGVLLGVTYEREFETVKIGWHRHQVGGIGDKAGGHAKVKSIAVIPSADGTRDELWMVVQRWNGTTWVNNIEYMTKIFEEEDKKSAFFVDCGLTYDNPLITYSTSLTLGATTTIEYIAHGFSNGDRIRLDDIPGTVELNDRVYLVANKTADTFEIKTLAGAAVDSSGYTPYAYDGTNGGKIRKLVTTVSGLSHLEGQTVDILADGQVHPKRVVASGEVTLNAPAAIVHVGYGYVSDGQQLRQEAGSTDGTALGKTRRTHRVGFYLRRTLGLQFGVDFTKLEKLVFRKTNDALGAAPELYSGIVSENLPSSYDFDNQICWRQDQPLPCTIMAIMPQMVTQDRG